MWLVTKGDGLKFHDCYSDQKHSCQRNVKLYYWHLGYFMPLYTLVRVFLAIIILHLGTMHMYLANVLYFIICKGAYVIMSFWRHFESFEKWNKTQKTLKLKCFMSAFKSTLFSLKSFQLFVACPHNILKTFSYINTLNTCNYNIISNNNTCQALDNLSMVFIILWLHSTL